MNLSLFWYFLRPYKLSYTVLVLVMIVSSALDALSLAALLPLLSSMVGEAGGNLSSIHRAVRRISDLVPVDDPIVAASIVLVLVFTARAFFGMLREILVAYTSGRAFRDVKNRLIEGFARRPYPFFLDNKLGVLMYRGLVAPSYVATMMRRFPQMAAEMLKAIAILAVLLMVFPSGVLVLGVLGLAYYQVIRFMSQKVSYNVGRERTTVSAEGHVIANELLTGIRQMVTFCTSGHWLERFKKKNARFTYLWMKDLVWQAMPKQLMEFSAVFLVLVLVFALRYRSGGDLASVLPELGIFVAGLVQLLPTVTDLGRMRMEIVGLEPECEAIHATLLECPQPAPARGRLFSGLRKGIVFEGVQFAHGGREPLLRDLNMVFEQGKVTALVGASGAGKSTIVNLLLGLYEPSGGRILVDGIPLSDYNLDSWRRTLGFVSQDPFVIHGTVAENIIFGRDGFSEQDVVAAAVLANADSFIRELPEGYQTLVGERGMKLSGGQQQRLCIARALLANPSLLLLDEATSSLDSVTERAIQETIREISENRTVIQIAHRASTVARADHIVVLHEGRIVEMGSHMDLLRNDGEYAKLFVSPAGN